MASGDSATAALEGLDPEWIEAIERETFNVNTPEDLARAEDLSDTTSTNAAHLKVLRDTFDRDAGVVVGDTGLGRTDLVGDQHVPLGPVHLGVPGCDRRQVDATAELACGAAEQHLLTAGNAKTLGVGG